MERRFRLEFGPSRSKRFGKAVAEARLRARGFTELEPDRYRAIFLVGADRAAYDAFAFLLERVRHWRASELYEGDEPVSAYQAFHPLESGVGRNSLAAACLTALASLASDRRVILTAPEGRCGLLAGSKHSQESGAIIVPSLLAR